jgi:hypothetical protein
MPNYYAKTSNLLVPFDDQIVIGVNRAKNTAWLRLVNTPVLLGCEAVSFGMGEVLIGAVHQPGQGWRTVQPQDTTGGELFSQVSDFSDGSAVFDFQRAIMKAWENFSGRNAADWAKGTTFGKSLTSASFVAKALKTGYEAIGKPMPTGWKFGDWSIDDLLSYAKKRTPRFHDPALIGFTAHPADPRYDNEDKKSPRNDTRDLDYIRSVAAKTHRGGFPYEKELAHVPFERVIGYGFRGETRSPGIVKAAGGFTPNYTRIRDVVKEQNDLAEIAKKYGFRGSEVLPRMEEFLAQQKAHGRISAADQSAIDAWKSKDTDALNLQEFIRQEDYRGFISTSKSLRTARNFAGGSGWVYACFVEGAFHLPRKGAHAWAIHDEGELAMPGMLDWDDVVGCRRVKACQFDGPVYLKRDLYMRDTEAARKIHEYLSGRIQPEVPGATPMMPVPKMQPAAPAASATGRRMSIGKGLPPAPGQPPAGAPGVAPPPMPGQPAPWTAAPGGRVVPGTSTPLAGSTRRRDLG